MAGVVIVGAGPGIATSVARRFAVAGMPAGLVARTEASIDATGPSGIHVATVTVGGAVAPGGRLDPDRIAEEYWRLHIQRPEAWEHEVLFTGAGTGPVR
jgi:hypothetical protein